MSTVIRRRIDGMHPPNKFKTNSELILLSNKSKSLNWWRVLGSKTASQFVCVPVSEKVCDQVRLDVERAFCFDSGFPSNTQNLFNIIVVIKFLKKLMSVKRGRNCIE